MNRVTKLPLITLLIFGIPTQAAELLPHKVSYSAKIKKGVSIKGSAIRELKKLDNGQWLYNFDVRSFIADIDESTRFSWHKQQIIPEQYKYKLSIFLAEDRLKKVDFDWQKMTATNPLKTKSWAIKDIPEKTLDSLSYQLQLAMDIHAGKQDMHYDVAHKGRLKKSHFRVTGEEKVETAFGKLDSITVKKVRDKSSKRQTYLWFSKQYPFFLLKMVQFEVDGERYEINIKQASVEGKPVTFH